MRTKGDANGSVDDWEVKYRDIQGRVVFQLPYMGYLVMTGKSMLSDLKEVGMPAPAVGGTLTIIAIILFVSGMESPPWESLFHRSKRKKFEKQVLNFLDSDKKKTRVENYKFPDESFPLVRKAVESLGKVEKVSVVRLNDDIYLVDNDKMEKSGYLSFLLDEDHISNESNT